MNSDGSEHIFYVIDLAQFVEPDHLKVEWKGEATDGERLAVVESATDAYDATRGRSDVLVMNADGSAPVAADVSVGDDRATRLRILALGAALVPVFYAYGGYLVAWGGMQVGTFVAFAASVVVLVPLGLLGGVPGAFFRPLALTMSIALLLSLVLALSFTPALAVAVEPPDTRVIRQGPGDRMSAWLVKFYARALSSWSLLIACQGLILDGPKGILGFKPNWQPNDHRSFFTAPAPKLKLACSDGAGDEEGAATLWSTGYSAASAGGTGTGWSRMMLINCNALATALPRKWLLVITYTSVTPSVAPTAWIRSIHGASSAAVYR